MTLEKRQRILNDLLDDYTLEELFEIFDIDPVDVLTDLLDNGLIDEEILNRITEIDYD